MAVRSPIIRDGMYQGKISNEQAKLILNIRNAGVVDGLKHMIFDFPPELIMQSLEEQRRIRDIIKDNNIDYTKYIGELRDKQTVGTAFMYASKRSIIGDSVGSGKTAEICALINMLKQKGELTKFLMAVEQSAFGQTACEIMRFTGLYIISLPSETAKMKKVIQNTDWSGVDGIIIKHSALKNDLLQNWLSLYLDEKGKSRIFNTFILDESSVIKNGATKTYRYTSNLCNISDRVHLMNATTFETHIMDIYYQVDMLDDCLLPKEWKIKKEYCTFKQSSYYTTGKDGKVKRNPKWDLAGYKNQKAFKESLKLVYFGRSKQELGLDKPHIHKVYEIYPSTQQGLALAKGYRYMEVLNSPANIPEINIPFDRKNVPKLDRLCRLVEDEFYDSSIMIYCFHKAAQSVIYNQMIELGRKPVIINGECKDSERWEAQQRYNRGEYDVLITNIKRSLNLYGGDVCIFYTVETNPSKMEQISGRINRNVDDKIKTFILLVYKGTDEYRFLTEVVRQRAKDARELTIDAKTTIDYFMESLDNRDEIE